MHLKWALPLFLAGLCAGQADQAAGVEKQKQAQADQQGSADKKKDKSATETLADLIGGSKFDPAQVERGRKIFVPTCGFCHGNDAHGKSGPDLVRSSLVAHDNKGDAIGPVVRNGRPDRGMPAFSSLTQAQIEDIAVFLHSRAADVSNRFAYKIGDIVTGDSKKGQAFFEGDGGCKSCHSPSGDLAHIAGKYDAVELQRRMLYPMPNFIEVFLGKVSKPPAPTQVVVQLRSGEQVSGTLDHIDEFAVSLHTADGWYRSFNREKDVKVEVHDPKAAHEALLPKYTDDEMHNVLAYLETLK